MTAWQIAALAGTCIIIIMCIGCAVMAHLAFHKFDNSWAGLGFRIGFGVLAVGWTLADLSIILAQITGIPTDDNWIRIRFFGSMITLGIALALMYTAMDDLRKHL